jgi:hypothetical protein
MSIINKWLGSGGQEELEKMLSFSEEQVSFELWQKIQAVIEEMKDDFAVVSLISGTPIDALKFLPASVWNPIKDRVAIVFNQIAAHKLEKLPPFITLLGHTYKVPEIEQIEAQRFEDLRALLSKGSFGEKDYPMLLSIIFCKDYTAKSVREFASRLEKERFTKIFWAAFFLSVSLRKWQQPIMRRSRLLSYLLKWLQRVMRS